jgi:hypothetical protein
MTQNKTVHIGIGRHQEEERVGMKLKRKDCRKKDGNGDRRRWY